MKAAIYSRVSTRDQDNENQLLQLRQFAASQGWELVGEYCDEVSGATSERPQFQRMFEDASRHRFEVLLFWSLDRLSREGVLETLQHLNRLTSYGIGWRSYTEMYLDSTGIFRDAVIGILAAVAKQERVRRSERTRAGLEKARSKGAVLGRRRVQVDAEAIRQLHSTGLSWGAIARQTGIARSTCQRAAAGVQSPHAEQALASSFRRCTIPSVDPIPNNRPLRCAGAVQWHVGTITIGKQLASQLCRNLILITYSVASNLQLLFSQDALQNGRRVRGREPREGRFARPSRRSSNSYQTTR